MTELKTKKEVREIIDGWLENYTDNCLFDIPIKWKNNICIQWLNNK